MISELLEQFWPRPSSVAEKKSALQRMQEHVRRRKKKCVAEKKNYEEILLPQRPNDRLRLKFSIQQLRIIT